MRVALVLVAILATACSGGNSPPATAASSPAASTAPRTSSATPPAPSPTGLACRIPVMLVVESGATPGGWITFPGGTFEADHSSEIPRIASPEDLSYDRAFNRWVLASWNHLSPDGTRFITEGLNGNLKVVSVATGAERQIAMPQARGVWTVIDFTPSGVYLTQTAGLGPVDRGLWLLNPDSGQVRQLDATQFWSQVDSRSAWGVEAVPRAMLLRRIDLQSGVLSTQLTVPYHTPLEPGDRLLELVSLDAQGTPVVLLRDWQQPYPWRVAMVVAPDTLQDVHIPDAWAAGWPMWDNGDPFQSGRELHGLLLSKGVWMFGTYSFPGLALLTPDGVLTQLTSAPNNIAAISGGCH